MTQRTVGWSLAELRARFLAIRERIEMHARIYFRHIRCWFKKDDLIAETIALAWKWFRRLAAKGKDARQFASALASFAARAVKSGRRVAGQPKAKDAMNEQAQQRHGFYVGKIPDFSTLDANPLSEALCETPDHDPARLAAFRCDMPAWLARLGHRNRKIAVEMAQGEKTLALARRFHISPGRVSQLRREFHEDWLHFTDELPSRN